MSDNADTHFRAILTAVADEMRERPTTAAATIATTVCDLQRQVAESQAGLHAMQERLRIHEIVRAGIGVHFDAERIEEIREDVLAFVNQLVVTLHLAIETDLSTDDAARALSAHAVNPGAPSQ